MSNTIQKQIYDTWLTMLKTGVHKQGIGALKRTILIEDRPGRKFFGITFRKPESHPETRYCAMGLLIEAARQVTGKSFLSSIEAGKLANIFGLGVFKNREKVKELFDKNPSWMPRYDLYRGDFNSVANLNDWGVSFKNIANILEEVPLLSQDERHDSIMPETIIYDIAINPCTAIASAT